MEGNVHRHIVMLTIFGSFFSIIPTIWPQCSTYRRLLNSRQVVDMTEVLASTYLRGFRVGYPIPLLSMQHLTIDIILPSWYDNIQPQQELNAYIQPRVFWSRSDTGGRTLLFFFLYMPASCAVILCGMRTDNKSRCYRLQFIISSRVIVQIPAHTRSLKETGLEAGTVLEDEDEGLEVLIQVFHVDGEAELADTR
ncbi:hypothetical protein K439DRAFT_1566182 [Ramaria rubella]|nr:hypothetical protein K439DRAFT_1566182 [Ramaria rubella]